MAGWKEVIFKGITASDLGVTGAAQGNLLMAGSTPFTYANFTAGAEGKRLTSHGTSADLTWETPTEYAPKNGAAQGNILMAGTTPFTFANLTAGAEGEVLTAHGATSALTWTSAGTGDFKADGTVAMTGNLDFNDNAAIDLKLYTTVPAVPADGHIYFDSVADKVKVYVA